MGSRTRGGNQHQTLALNYDNRWRLHTPGSPYQNFPVMYCFVLSLYTQCSKYQFNMLLSESVRNSVPMPPFLADKECRNWPLPLILREGSI